MASLPVRAPLISALVLENPALASPSAEPIMHLCSITHAYQVLKDNYRHLLHNYIQQGNVDQAASTTVNVMQDVVLRFQAMI